MNPLRQIIRSAALRSIVSGVLALWIFVLSLAGVSPALHDWLHTETDSNCCASQSQESRDDSAETGHFCGVTALAGGALAVEAVALPESILVEWLAFVPLQESVAIARIERALGARAPPIEVVV